MIAREAKVVVDSKNKMGEPLVRRESIKTDHDHTLRVIRKLVNEAMQTARTLARQPSQGNNGAFYATDIEREAADIERVVIDLLHPKSDRPANKLGLAEDELKVRAAMLQTMINNLRKMRQVPNRRLVA